MVRGSDPDAMVREAVELLGGLDPYLRQAEKSS